MAFVTNVDALAKNSHGFLIAREIQEMSIKSFFFFCRDDLQVELEQKTVSLAFEWLLRLPLEWGLINGR